MDGPTLTLDSAVRIGMRSPTTGVLGPLLPLKIPQPESSATAVTAAVKRIDLFTFMVPTSGRTTGIVIQVSLDRIHSQYPSHLHGTCPDGLRKPSVLRHRFTQRSINLQFPH